MRFRRTEYPAPPGGTTSPRRESMKPWHLENPAEAPFLPTLLSQNSSDRAEIQLYRRPYFPQGRAPVPQSKDPIDRPLRDSRRHGKVAQNGQYVMNGGGGNSQPFSDLPQSEAFSAHGNDLIVAAIVARPPAHKKHAALG